MSWLWESSSSDLVHAGVINIVSALLTRAGTEGAVVVGRKVQEMTPRVAHADAASEIDRGEEGKQVEPGERNRNLGVEENETQSHQRRWSSVTRNAERAGSERSVSD